VEWQNALVTFSDVNATFDAMNDVSHDATFAGFVAEIQSHIASISTTAMRSISKSGSASAISSPHRLAQADPTS
jgi:glutamate 5-kinase